MIGSGLPEGLISLHPLEADDDVLHGLIQGMAHVELAGDVRRRNDNGKGLLGVIHDGVEVLLLLPLLVDPVLDALGIVGLGKFSLHDKFLFDLV